MLCRARVASLGAVTGSRGTSFPDTCLPYAFVGQCLGRRSRTLPVAASGEYRMDIQALLTERKRVTDALEALGGVKVLPTDTHYFLHAASAGYCGATEGFLATDTDC